MSSAVLLYLVTVIPVITAGSVIAGIADAAFSALITAFINTTVTYLHGYNPMPELATAGDRPGGPPGMLEEKIAASYAGKPDAHSYAARGELSEDEVVAPVDLYVEVHVESEGNAAQEKTPTDEEQKPGEPPAPYVEV